MNQFKSAYHTTDHFGSVKYAEFVDPMEESENSCFVPKNSGFLSLSLPPMTQLATVKITV